MAEQDYRGGLALADKQGEARGRADGLMEGLRQAVADLCEVLGIGLSPEQRSQLSQMDLAQLQALREHLKAARGWPV